MKLSLYEQETIILYNQAEAMHNLKYIAKLTQLAQKRLNRIYPQDTPIIYRVKTV